MIRTTLDQAYIKRSIRPLYAFDQAIPKGMSLDPAWDRSVEIFPGMVVKRTTGSNVTLIDGTGTPYGLIGNFVGGYGVDELLESGVNACGVWVLNPGAELEIDAPAFNSALTWTDPGTGVNPLVYAQTTGATRGQLVPAGTSGASAAPVARLLGVVSNTTIIIGGLQGTAA